MPQSTPVSPNHVCRRFRRVSWSLIEEPEVCQLCDCYREEDSTCVTEETEEEASAPPGKQAAPGKGGSIFAILLIALVLIGGVFFTDWYTSPMRGLGAESTVTPDTLPRELEILRCDIGEGGCVLKVRAAKADGVTFTLDSGCRESLEKLVEDTWYTVNLTPGTHFDRPNIPLKEGINTVTLTKGDYFPLSPGIYRMVVTFHSLGDGGVTESWDIPLEFVI